MENIKYNLNKVKKWNMIALIFVSINTLFSVISLPSVLIPNKSLYTDLGAEGMAIYYQLVSLSSKIFNIINVILLLFFSVLFLLAHKLIKKGSIPPKYPYYLNLIWTIISILYSLLKIPTTSENHIFQLITGIVPIIFTLLIKIPIFMIIIYLFKLTSGGNDVQKIN